MNISQLTKCSNCGACYNICPRGAITVNKKEIFYRPKVDPSLCVHCGACVQACPVQQEIKSTVPVYACAGWHKEERVVLESSSGGAFYGMAKKVLAEGGIVFGAVYAPDWKTVAFTSTDETSLQKMQKSKYVESLVGLSFRRIKAELEKGRSVLFCGTPCQTAGLVCFLGREYENLITCDFACGGLPSHEIYQNYVDRLEKKYRSVVKSVDFRPKTHGWKRYAVQICFENGKKYNRLGVEDEYLKSFLYGKYTVRDYCLECKFSACHLSDITIADFWRHNDLSTLSNENGISLILCNTQKGKQMIASIREQYAFSEIDVKDASYNNKKPELSEQLEQRHKAFLELYEEKGLAAASKKFLPCSPVKKVKNRMIRAIYRSRMVSK